jgi:hypothetical protein
VNVQVEAHRQTKTPKAGLVPLLQEPELVHVTLPKALHERRKPGAKLPAECGRSKPRTLPVLRFAIRDFRIREATERNKNGKQLVGLGECLRRQHLPRRLGIVKYFT